MNKRISVAMTTYNGHEFILEQLESIRCQTIQVDEVIVCDDLSTDNTVKLVTEFIEKHNLHSWVIIANKTRLGFCMNFWKSISLCNGEVVFLCDQDDVWYPDKVKNMVSVMKNDKNINFVASSYDICNDKGRIIDVGISYGRSCNNEELEDIKLDYLIGRSPVRGCSICFKREIINETHHTELKSGLAHDWLIACIASINGRAVYYNKKLFKYRIHGSNTSDSTNKLSANGIQNAVRRRINYLNEENVALSILLSQDLNNEYSRKLIKSQIVFVNLREDLIYNMSLRSALKLSQRLSSYSRIFSRGFIDGARVYLSDIGYAAIAKMSMKMQRMEKSK